MIFNEPAYFLLLAVAALVFRSLPGSWKPWWLAVTGILFYIYFSPRYAVLLSAEIAAVYLLGVVVRRGGTSARLAFGAGLALTIGLLVGFKVFGAWTPAGSTPGDLPSFADLQLPLAISFFTFEFVHYIVDARRDKLPDHRIADFLAFALFAPTLVAGPIKRFQGFFAQVREARATAEDITAGTTRILSGLAKKVVLADTLTLWVTPLASDAALETASSLEIVTALFAYSLRIYFDFSGYSDIAIGSARLFGLRVPENFSWPYLKTNISDFWRSWHMSLMRWIRDYVYIPLGGNRRGLLRQMVNLLIAFAVSGLWHGMALNFLCWGLYHGGLMAGHLLWTKRLKPRLRWVTEESPVSTVLHYAGAIAGAVVTFTLVTAGWALFAMPLPRIALMIRQLTQGGL